MNENKIGEAMRRLAGFTLIEILLAMTVFLIGVVSILVVFPRATQQSYESNDNNIAAAFAESIMETLSRSLKSYTGNPDVTSGSESDNDLVYFSLPLEDGVQQDYFMLPRGPFDKTPQTEMTWYPIAHGGGTANWITTIYDARFLNQLTVTDPFLGFNANQARVRRMGRETLGTSVLIEQIESTEIDVPERLKEFFWCFSVRHEGTTSNLYHVTLYIFRGGVQPGGTDTSLSAHFLLDDTKPQSKANQFFHKFDFLIGKT